MSKRQRRRAVSIRPSSYAKLSRLAGALGLSGSALVEHAIDDLASAQGIDVTAEEVDRMQAERERRSEALKRRAAEVAEERRREVFG